MLHWLCQPLVFLPHVLKSRDRGYCRDSTAGRMIAWDHQGSVPGILYAASLNTTRINSWVQIQEKSLSIAERGPQNKVKHQDP